MEDSHQPPGIRSAGRLGARLERKPAVGRSAPLLRALARAHSPEEAAVVLFGQETDLSGLPPEAIRVLEQLERAGERFSADQAVVVRGARAALRASTRARTVGSRRLPGSRPVVADADTLPGGPRLSRLAARLKELIHVAESEKRVLEARSRARLAENDAQARAEGSEAPAPARKEEQEVDLDALGREVADQVSRELDLRRNRHAEDSHG